MREAFTEKLNCALQSEDLDLSVPPFSVTKKGDGEITHPRVIAQKQPGLYAVSYHPIGGNPTPECIHRLYDAILPMEDVEIRLSPDEGMYLINCTAKEAETLLALTDDGAETLFETSVITPARRQGFADSAESMRRRRSPLPVCRRRPAKNPHFRLSFFLLRTPGGSARLPRRRKTVAGRTQTRLRDV